jgi:cellulose synthase/poly-beta-1,6-N-acetylglucosamine synthase-like glycosyltransferase
MNSTNLSTKIINRLTQFKHQIIFVIMILVLVIYSTPFALSQTDTLYYEIEQPYGVLHEKIEGGPSEVLFVVSHVEDDYFEVNTQKIALLGDLVMSHWDSNVQIIRADEYTAGLIDEYDVIFYINESNEPPSQVLFEDLLNARDKQILLSGFNAQFVNMILESNISPTEQLVDWVEYKDVRFPEDELRVLYDASEYLTNPLVTVHAVAGNDDNPKVIPVAFAVESKQFGFLSDSRSVYLFLPLIVPHLYSIDDYSVVMLDLLHEVLGEHRSVKKQALLRLEDVNSFTYRDPTQLQKVYDFLKETDTRFHIALIPRYVNPLDEIDITLDSTRRFYHLLKRMIGEGYATPVQHGYTHQIGTSISGVGFEFWDEENWSPLQNESNDYVVERIIGAQDAMKEVDLPVPDIWETPHYAASELARTEIEKHYPLLYERHPKIGALPFAAKIDNNIYIPENLGFVSDGFDESLFGLNQSVDDIEENLRLLHVFRDPVASVFWHPWRDIDELKKIVSMMEDNGYTFVSVYDLLEDTNEPELSGLAALSTFRDAYSPLKSYQITNWLLISIYVFFVFGCVFYLRTIVRLKRYLKIIGTFDKSLPELAELFRAQNHKFPMFAIFVPARNEGLVISNTLYSLAKLDYPKEAYKIFVIGDERELDDDVEVLTRDEVIRVKHELKDRYGKDFINYLEVPRWYSGIYNDLTEADTKSTKGRALNFALQMVEQSSYWTGIDMVGVLDADGRLHPNVLKEVAFNRVQYGSKILQGPVFQVSNFKNVKLVGIAAGLELAIHHITELPANLLRPGRVQFLAGTNYFIDKNLIVEVGGWDQHALVEDAELALRAYVKARVVADWIGSPEIEQTPQNFSIYKKQRRRWVRGHLDLIKIVMNSDIEYGVKARFYWKIFTSQFRFILDLGVPLLAITFLIIGIYTDIGGYTQILSIILLLFAVLMWDLYGSIYRRIGGYIDPTSKFGHKAWMSSKLFVFSPVFMCVQSIPRILALKDYVLSVPTQWYKTERTREQNIT